MDLAADDFEIPGFRALTVDTLGRNDAPVGGVGIEVWYGLLVKCRGGARTIKTAAVQSCIRTSQRDYKGRAVSEQTKIENKRGER